jgi:hypothetical protein
MTRLWRTLTSALWYRRIPVATFRARSRHIFITGQLVLENLAFWARYRYFGVNSRSCRVSHARKRYRITRDSCKTKAAIIRWTKTWITRWSKTTAENQRSEGYAVFHNSRDSRAGQCIAIVAVVSVWWYFFTFRYDFKVVIGAVTFSFQLIKLGW